MKAYLKTLLTCFILTATICTVEASNVKELSTVLKEIIESPLSNEDTKFSFDLYNYRIKHNHIANIDIGFQVDRPFLQITGEISARHPELGSIGRPFQGMGKAAIFVGHFEIEMKEALLELEEGKESIVTSRTLKPLSMETWECFLNGIKEYEISYFEKGVSLEADILKQNEEGLIESFVLLLNQLETNNREFELIFTLNKTKLDIQIARFDHTMNYRIFEDNEQSAITIFENLREKDPSTIAIAQSFVQLVKDYINMFPVPEVLTLESTKEITEEIVIVD